jgi:hypothetical protein
MTDTPAFIYQKQFEIIFSKPKQERYLMGFEMMATVRTIVVNSIKKQHPSISERDLWIAVFKRYYQNDFTPIQLDKIIQAFIAHSHSI